MTVPQPIPYQGSKRRLAATISRYFPPDVERLVEPFAGSAAVSLYAASTNKVKRFLLNDINAPLMQLWETLIVRPDLLADQYERLWQAQLGRERKFYDAVRMRFNHTHRPDYFLYLLARCVKGAVRYNAHGEFNQSPDNRRKGRQPGTMRKDIQRASQLLSTAQIRSGDYQTVLRSVSQNDIVYMDPPYQGVISSRDKRYLQQFNEAKFITQLQELNDRQIAYIVSYDGRTGAKTFGKPLPDILKLYQIEIHAGRSSQATLLGRTDNTIESLYLSPALVSRLAIMPQSANQPLYQPALLPEFA